MKKVLTFVFLMTAAALLFLPGIINEAEALQILGPASPSNLSANNVASSSVDLSWTDNADNELFFEVYRKNKSSSYGKIAAVNANVTKYSDKGVQSLQTYYYKVRAVNLDGDSTFSNEVNVFIPAANGNILGGKPPAVPSNLKAFAINDTEVELIWQDNSSTEKGFEIQRKAPNGTFKTIDTVGTDILTFIDHGLSPGNTYIYRVCGFNQHNNSNYSNEAKVTLQGQGTSGPGGQTPANPAPGTSPGGAGTTTIKLRIGSTDYSVNGNSKKMDASPVVRDGRTFLPIRYVAQPLGASVGWDAGEEKASVTLGNKVIELWIGENRAMVNGKEQFIDQSNADVVPLVLPPGRTMLPLRFVAETLGCKVDWDGQTNTVIVTSDGAASAGGTTPPSGNTPNPVPEVWTGTWQTDYGPVKLQQQGNQVTGIYDVYNSASINGTVTGNKLIGTWKDTGSSGDLEFTLSPDSKSFTGKWRYAGEGAGAWRQWNGTKN